MEAEKDREFEWNSIYEADAKNYRKLLDSAEEYYRMIPSEEYDTLQNCVGHALREGNHTAFTHFFLDRTRNQNCIFGRTLSTYITEQKGRDGFDVRCCWNTAPVIQQKYWRAFDFEYTKETIFTRIRKTKTIAYSINLESKEETQGRGNWRRGQSIPPRDVIIQLAICLGLSIPKTNTLLRAAGEPSLYVLDCVDACSMFSLRRYQDDFTVSPFEKLKRTKKEINRVLTECMSNGMRPIAFSRVHNLGSEYPLGERIDQEIQEIRDAIESSESSRISGITNTRFLTRLYEQRFRDAAGMDSLLQAAGKEDYSVFLQKYYGFLRRTKRYLINRTRYSKNLRYSSWELTADGCRKAGFSIPDAPTEDVREEVEKGLKLIERIWHISDLPDPAKLELFTADNRLIMREKAGGYTAARQIFEGRKTEAKRDEYAYQMDFGSKGHLIKFAIASGNEDEAGDYLTLAGVWDRDWYGAYGKSKLKEEALLDRRDCLLVYALLYRDALIKEWANRLSIRDTEDSRRIKEMFPMIKLLLLISRDISFVFMKLYDEDGKRRDYDHTKDNTNVSYRSTAYYEDTLSKLQEEMIFPIAWSYRTKKTRNQSLDISNAISNYQDIALWRQKVDPDN